MTLRSFLGSPTGLAVCLLAAAIGAWLLWFHTGHVFLAIPYLVLLACPLMHVMHRGHHHLRHNNDNPAGQPTDQKPQT
jgi:hypothetical protein